MAALTDKITSTKNGTNPITTTVASGRSIGGTSLSCVALDGWSTSTKVHFITYKKTVAGAIDKTTQCDWAGIVSGTTVGSLTLENGTDAGNDVGDFVEMAPTASWAQDLHDGLTKDHDVNGQHVQLTDTNGVKILGLTPTASAVNQVSVTNSTTGTGPTISATGSDTNIDLKLAPKGTGLISVVSSLFNFSSQVTSFTNSGSAGGTGYYINLGGIKLCWGTSATIATPAGAGPNYTTATVNLPAFFTTIQSISLNTAAIANNAYLVPVVGASSTSSFSLFLLQPTGSNGNATVSWLIIGT